MPIFAGAAYALFAAVDATWIGPASGNWGDSANWSGGAVPHEDGDIARIVSSTPVTVAMSSEVRLAELHVSGAAHTLSYGKDPSLVFKGGTTGEAVLDVAAGATCTCAVPMWSVDHLGMKLVKTGGGEFIQTCNGVGKSKFAFNTIDVRGGTLTFQWGPHTDGCCPNKRIHVCAGATLKTCCMNCIQNDVVIDLDEGGVYDQQKQGDCIGGVTGAGVATNLYNATFTLGGGPLVFSGRLHGSASFYRAGSGLGIDTPEHTRFVVGATNTLADFTINNMTNIPGYKVLSFVPGVKGPFKIYGASWPRQCPLVLEDENDDPVCVDISTDVSSRPVRGKGSLTLNYGYVVTNDLVRIGGVLRMAEKGKVLRIGYTYPEQDADLSGLTAVDIAAGANLWHFARSGDDWGDTVLMGGGEFDKSTTVDWTLPFASTNGNFYFTKASDGSSVTFTGGVSTNVTLNLKDVVNATVNFTGGTHDFTLINASQNHRFTQSGGTVIAHPLTGYYSKNCSNEVFYTMTGGTLISHNDTAYPRGLGLDLSGDARVFLRMTNPTFNFHRICSDGDSHTVTLRDNALLDVDSIYVAMGGNTPGYHAGINLLGGCFRVEKDVLIGSGAADFSPDFTTRVLFDGGWVETVHTGNRTWTFAPSLAMSTGYVGRAGLKWHSNNFFGSYYTWLQLPLVSNLGADEVDGGVLKTGRGTLVTYKDAFYTGPTRVKSGMLRSTGPTTSPFGSGSIELSDSRLGFDGSGVSLRACTAPGATFSYAGASALAFWNVGASTELSLELGSDDATADSVLVRSGHGVLFIDSYGMGNVDLGGTRKILVKGGVSLDPHTGLVAAPVFGSMPMDNVSWQSRLQPLTYGAATGFRVATPTEGVAGGANSVARISSAPVALSGDAHVGALWMRYQNGSTANGGLAIPVGVTLTVGNGAGTLAPVLLDNFQLGSNNPSQTIDGAGTLDFGAAEGVILCNLSYFYGWYRPSQINCVVAGSNGVTVAGVADSMGQNCLFQFGNVNTFTGGLWIQNVGVIPMKNGSLSSGPVTVTGNEMTGGSLYISGDSAATTVPNALTLCGVGRYTEQQNYQQEDPYGAVRVDRSATFTGPVTLAGDTRIFAKGANVTAVYSGGISGTGDLTVSGSGTTRLTAASTFTGRTIVDGVLELADGGTFGVGAVEVTAGGVLRFANAQPITVTNDVSGAGRIVLAGAAVTFTGNVDAFAGDVSRTGAVPGDNLVKEGANTLTLTSAQTYTGATEVRGGTLALGPVATDAAPFAENLVAHLDATAAASLAYATATSPTNVASWTDSVSGIVYSQATAAQQPMLNPGAINGHDALWFEGGTIRLAANKTITSRSVFAVARASGKGYPADYGSWSCAGLFGHSGIDSGIRCSQAKTWATDSWAKFADTYVNGVRTSSWAYDTPMVCSFLLSLDFANKTTAVGDYWGSSYARGFRGDIGEILVYDRALDAEERCAVEAYLAEKWNIVVTKPARATANVLPVTTDVTVADGAVLDLAGTTQTVHTVAGAGVVRNSASSRAVLVITGNTTMTWSLEGNVALYVPAGVTLDLNGRTVSVAEIGGSGRIVNGTLVVTDQIQPGGPGAVGTLTFATAPAVAGATLVVEGDGVDGCDKLAVEEPFDLTGLSLRVVDYRAVRAAASVLVETTARTGMFAADNRPNTKVWRIDYTEDEARLLRSSGTVFLLK